MSRARRNFDSRSGEVINLLDKKGGRLVLARLDSGFLAHVARSSGGPPPVAFEDVASGLLRVVHREVVIRFQPSVLERRRRAILGWFGFAVRRRNAFIPDQVIVCHPGGKYAGEELIEVSNLLTALDEVALATARDSNAIAVGAATDLGRLADYSNLGPEVAVVAPSSGGAQALFTTDVSIPGRGFNPYSLHTDRFGGTSAATPLAAGTGALVLSVHPGLSREELKELLRSTADEIGGGCGCVNAGQAVSEALKRAGKSG